MRNFGIFALVCLILIVFGGFRIFSGIKGKIRYRKNLTAHVKGKVISSHYEKYTENGNEFYDMYATVNYEINGKAYQYNFEFEQLKKYYHFLSHGNILDLSYNPSNPLKVSITRLLRYSDPANDWKIKSGIYCIIISLIVAICLYSIYLH